MQHTSLNSTENKEVIDLLTAWASEALNMLNAQGRQLLLSSDTPLMKKVPTTTKPTPPQSIRSSCIRNEQSNNEKKPASAPQLPSLATAQSALFSQTSFSAPNLSSSYSRINTEDTKQIQILTQSMRARDKLNAIYNEIDLERAKQYLTDDIYKKLISTHESITTKNPSATEIENQRKFIKDLQQRIKPHSQEKPAFNVNTSIPPQRSRFSTTTLHDIRQIEFLNTSSDNASEIRINSASNENLINWDLHPLKSDTDDCSLSHPGK